MGSFRAMGERRTLAYALYSLGEVYAALGQAAEARACHDENLANARETGARQVEAWALSGLGCLAYTAGRHARARQLLEDSLLICRDIA